MISAPSRPAPQPSQATGTWETTTSGLSDMANVEPGAPRCLPGRRRFPPPRVFASARALGLMATLRHRVTRGRQGGVPRVLLGLGFQRRHPSGQPLHLSPQLLDHRGLGHHQPDQLLAQQTIQHLGSDRRLIRNSGNDRTSQRGSAHLHHHQYPTTRPQWWTLLNGYPGSGGSPTSGMSPQAMGAAGSDQNGLASASLTTSCTNDCTYIPFDR